MATGLEDQSASGTGYAKVQNNSLQATGPQDAPDNAGFAMLATEQNPADVGVLRKTRPLEADPDYRLRVGGDTLLFNELAGILVVDRSSGPVAARDRR
jgi:hypothetical protein